MRSVILGAAALTMLTVVSGCASTEELPEEVVATVIEIATFDLNEGVSASDFAVYDQAVEEQHVALQPGFVSRETGFNEDGQWLVVVHWDSVASADASMSSFATAPAAADFMANLQPATMAMKRYDIQ